MPSVPIPDGGAWVMISDMYRDSQPVITCRPWPSSP